MPKSKRSKVIHLTKTKKQPKEKKNDLIEEIRDNCEKYGRLYVLAIENERNAFLQVVRQKLRPGRLICARNKVMQLALGTSPSQECQDNLHKIADKLTGQCALLFSDQPPVEVQKILAEYRPMDFSRAGSKSIETVVLPRGTNALASLPHSIEAHLRQLGVSTQLIDGKIHLLGDHTACTQDKEITSDGAQVLKLMGIKQAQFTMDVIAHWSKDGSFVDCEDMED